ncbi:type III pantothenate kinase [Marinifilum sp.]|uniref:type III pantothenate kinase n=1 Tax=Marinifilum sp. TaxID=2033137 RepID=UPI003BACAF35
MNLIIDIGNTKIKASLFQDGKLMHTLNSDQTDTEFVQEITDHYNITHAIVSSVREFPFDLMDLLYWKTKSTFFFDMDLPVPIDNLYASKNTLGYDRLAACIGANAIYPRKNILVIDAGTAITFDFVNCKGQYEGGCISPGLSMRFKALNQFTKKLPLLSLNENYHLIGKNTEEAITGGVQNGIIFEIDSYITNLKSQYTDLEVLLTGGDAKFLHKNTNNNSSYEPNVLAIGLNHILDFNISKPSNNK